jgi:hypothetical protein
MSSVPYSTPRPRDRISAMYDTKIINPLNNEILVWSSADQVWENANSSVLPTVIPDLFQVLTIGNNATGLDITSVNTLTANQILPIAPSNFDAANSNADGLYSFKIQTGSFNQNPASTQLHLQNTLYGFPTEQISINLNNKSLNADTRIMSQFVPYTSPTTLVAGTSQYCLNFGSQLTGNDECYYDPMNMRFFYDTGTATWIACSTPFPFSVSTKGSWTITAYLVGTYPSPSPDNNVKVILEQWRSNALFRSYNILNAFPAPSYKGVNNTANFVFSGLYEDDWVTNTDEWRCIVENENPVRDFSIEKLNITFEWRQLS